LGHVLALSALPARSPAVSLLTIGKVAVRVSTPMTASTMSALMAMLAVPFIQAVSNGTGLEGTTRRHICDGSRATRGQASDLASR
jgi:hypothetical protein